MNPPVLTSETRYKYAERKIHEAAVGGSALSVFDIGVGSGPMRESLRQRGVRYTGFDIRPKFDDVIRWDLTEPCPLPSAQADFVLLLEVIEHLLNAGLALDNLSAVVRPGGCLLITTPNPRWSRSRLEALRTGYPTFFKVSDLEGNGHVFPVFPHVLERILADRGFVIEEYAMLKAPTRWPAFAMRPHYALSLLHTAANKLIERMDSTAAGGCYAVLARKRGAAVHRAGGTMG